MQDLKVAPSKNTPEVFMSSKGIIKIKGRSTHENVSAFFTPVETWINEYIANPAKLTTINLNFEYFNSSSSKALINMLQQITQIEDKDKSFVINWYYEDGDDDILERGEYFASILGISMNFIKM
jgi:hypothetical protein